MKKIDSTVLKETAFVASVTFILSVLLQAVFLVAGKWDYTVLLGNVLGAAAGIGNFFLMGLTVQSSLGLEVKDAKSRMKLSQMLRTLLMFAVAVVGYLVPVFNLITVVIPFLFPRIAVTVRAIMIKKQG
ncbi:MAG: hypothetical protein IJN70_00195 [Clostridia bacterium]|nr:hypothetical protein [Clostridia bacterium]